MSIVLSPNLEQRITRLVESGQYHSVDEVIEKGLNLLDVKEISERPESTGEHPSVWELARRIRSKIPEEAFDSVPADLSINHDHYLYGTPKVSE